MTDRNTTFFCCLLDMQIFMVGGQVEKTYFFSQMWLVIFFNISFSCFIQTNANVIYLQQPTFLGNRWMKLLKN